MLRKVLFISAGVFLMVLGILMWPLPGPLGVPPFMLGLVLVLRNATWSKRLFIRVHRRFPKMVGPVRSMLRPGAKVVSIVWLTTLRVERRFLRTRRFMQRTRQEIKALLGMRFSRRRWRSCSV